MGSSTTTTPAAKRGRPPPPATKPRPSRWWAWASPFPSWLVILVTAALAVAVAWQAAGPGGRARLSLHTAPATTPAPSTTCAAAPAAAGLAPPSPPPPSDACWPAGDGCPAAQLEAANAQLAPILADLVKTPFFRYFKVSLTCGCPFWREEDGMCALQDCAVCECPDTDVPPAFTAAEVEGGAPAEHGSCRRLGRLGEVVPPGGGGGDAADGDDAAAAEPDVDRWVDAAVRARLVSVRGWRGIDNPWMDGGGAASEAASAAARAASSSSDREYTYIDLTKNPERYTGYKGPAARRVWEFIYSQACFAGVAPGGEGSGSGSGSGPPPPPPPSSAATCGDAPARTTFFRIMSGVHASITSHIASDYLMNEAARVWGPNLALYKERLGGPANAWRRSNLRFAHAFVARAVAVAGPLLEAADYRVGGGNGGGNGGVGGGGGGGNGGPAPATDGDGVAEHRLVHDLLASPGLAAVCGAPWDGAKALATADGDDADGGGGRADDGRDAVALTAGMQAAFRNVTAVMDCVGCEKCRLWGKLQLLGVATALKVLVADTTTTTTAAAAASPPLTLERNEAVALVNLFDRLARSVAAVASFEAQLSALGGAEPAGPVSLDSGGDGLAAAFGF